MTSLIRHPHLYDGDVAVYLCGPPPMVESVRTHVDESRHRANGLLLRKVRAGPRRRRTETGISVRVNHTHLV